MPDNPLKNLNCYVIREAGKCLIIDTGFNRPECAKALEAGLAELRVNLEQARLFVTHLHSDHCGLAEGLAAKGVLVYMSGIDHDYLRCNLDGSNWPIIGGRFLREGFPKIEMALQSTGNQGRSFAPKELFPVIRVTDEDIFNLGKWTFSCIHTPGHTPGHMCLYCEELGILFSGDHILFDITPNISVWNDVPHSLADYLTSLEKLKALSISKTFPAHRKWRGDTHERIDAITQHHRLRLHEIFSAVQASPGMNAYDIAGRITWSARGKPWPEFSPHQHWFAMGETLAHLEWLLHDNYLSADKNRQYSLTGRKPAW